MTLSGNTTLLSWGDTGARGQTGRAGGEPDQQRTESEQRQPRQRGPTDTQTGVRYPTDMEEQQPTQDRRLQAAPSQGSLTGRADQTGSAAPAGLAGRLHQQQPQRNPAQRREQQNTHQLHPITSPTPAGAGPPQHGDGCRATSVGGSSMYQRGDSEGKRDGAGGEESRAPRGPAAEPGGDVGQCASERRQASRPKSREP